jgi:hypothetical protein
MTDGIIQHSYPGFFDGVYLSASDINQIAQEQQYIYGMYQHLRFAQEISRQDWYRYMLHRYRYLHIRTSDVTTIDGSHLLINGIDAGPVAATSNEFVVDLGNGEDVFVSNPYNLSLNKPYTLQWQEGEEFGGVEMWWCFEHPHDDGLFHLPQTVPTFTTGANAAQLNALSDDTRYLVENQAMMPPGCFTSRSFNFTGTSTWRYFIWHQHRYLHCSARWAPSGEDGINHEVKFKINGVEFFGHTGSGEGTWLYSFAYDMQGDDHQSFDLPVEGHPTFHDVDEPSVGWYTIDVTVNNPDPFNTRANFQLYMIAESPFTSRIA